MVMMELVGRMKKVRAKEMMGTMEIVMAVMVVVTGILPWLVKPEATVTMKITARVELLRVT